MQRNLDGAPVVVTGASSGIGRETALAFAEAGARLVLDVRDEEAVEALRRGEEAHGGIDCWVDNPSRAALRRFREQGTGVLNNVSSVVGEPTCARCSRPRSTPRSSSRQATTRAARSAPSSRSTIRPWSPSAVPSSTRTPPARHHELSAKGAGPASSQDVDTLP